jgi:plastocyanin
MARSGSGLRLLAAASLVSALCATALDASAAKIRGAISGFETLVNPVWDEAKDPDRHLYSFREPVPTVRAEFRKLFPHIPKEVCVAALSSEKQPAHEPILVRVGGGRTTPVTIVVTPGTTLQFQNTDPFTHRLFGVGIKTFLASDTVKGGTRSWTVPGPGAFEIRDERAPSLRMWVIGDPNVAAIAYPSLKGEFVLSVSTPGDYRVQAYFAGDKVGSEVPLPVELRDIDITRQPLKLVPKKAPPAPKK